MRWNAPLSELHASILFDALRLDGCERVLDLGCGWAELLIRAVERTPGLRGVGVDTDSGALARGRALVAARGVGDRVELIETTGERYAESASRVICVGASHIWDGTEGALRALAGIVPTGGRLLYGDGCFVRAPSATTAEIFDGMLPFSDLVRAVDAAGWRVLHLSMSDRLEWDEFESSFRAGPEEWLLANPEVPGADDVRSWLDGRRAEYLDGYRDELGFCWLVLAR